VRSFGKNAIYLKKKTFRQWISKIPISEMSIIDVTLIECNTLNVKDYYGHHLPNPVVLYRKPHHFEHVDFQNINVWERIDTDIHINTRYQKTGQCMNKQTQQMNICSSSAIDSYMYKANKVNINTSICFVGASHSRKLFEKSKKMGIKSYFFKRLYVKNIVSFAKNVDVLKCENIVIHTGQWDLGWPENRITPIEEYKKYLHIVLKTLKKTKYSIYLLSNNYNPLSDMIMTGTDWRRPDVIDTYNEISKNIAKIYHVSYIDNNYEVGGVAWDSASDWCHYDSKVMKAVLINTVRHINGYIN